MNTSMINFELPRPLKRGVSWVGLNLTLQAKKMWHEARKQEKKIREVMVDFQKRAERRREHFEKTVSLS